MTKDAYQASKAGTMQLAQQGPAMAQKSTAPVKQEPLYKGYNEYFAGNPEAQKWGHYRTSAMPGTAEGNQLSNLNFVGANPYKFAMEYNQYKAGLPEEYRALASAGIDPSRVESGEIKNVLTGGRLAPIPLRGGGYAGQGSGSTHALSPEVLGKMWR